MTKNFPAKEGFSKTFVEYKIGCIYKSNGKITNLDVREMFRFSNCATLDEINKLIELQALKFQGKGRALHYIL